MSALFVCATVICIAVSGQITGYEFVQYESYNDWIDATLECDDNKPCVVNCYGFTACQEVDIVGPKNSILTINCNGNYNNKGGGGQGCVRPTIYAQNSTKLFINVYNDDYQFYGGTIYTPISNTDEINTYITCGIITSYTKQNESDGTCLESQNIYSINGFQSVQWKYDESSYWVFKHYDHTRFIETMYCGDNYQYSCSPFVIENGETYLNCNHNTSLCAKSHYINSMNNTQIITNSSIITTQSQTASATDVATETSMDRICDNNDEWDFANCTDVNVPREGSILFTVSVNVCLLDDRFSRSGIWNLYKSTYKAIIVQYIHDNNACKVELESFYVEIYRYRFLNGKMRRRRLNRQRNVDCDAICDVDSYEYMITTQIGLFCSNLAALESIYEGILTIINSGVFHDDFKIKFLGFSVDGDSVCKKGFGSIQVESAKLQLRDRNGDDLDVVAISGSVDGHRYKVPLLIVIVVLIIVYSVL